MEAIISALTTSVGSISEDFFAVAAIVVPAAFVIWGAFLAVRYGKKFFSNVAK